MYKELAKLILYRDLGEDSILLKLSGIFRDYELDLAEKENLTSRIYEQMKALLDLSTQYISFARISVSTFAGKASIRRSSHR